MHFYSSLVNGFNEYSKKNNLDITLDITILTPENTTSGVEDYSTYIDDLLKRKSQKYDIYFYYGSNSYRYSSNFENLYNYLSKEELDNYFEEILNSGVYDGVLTGIVII